MESVTIDCSLKADLAVHFCYFPSPKFSPLTYLSDFSTDLEKNGTYAECSKLESCLMVQKPFIDD